MEQTLVIGSTCADVIITVERLPKTAEDIHILTQSLALGGCAFNAANILRQAQVPVTFITPVGGGLYGEFVAKGLAERGFADRVPVAGENGCCYCLVEAGGERTFLCLRGVEYTFDPRWLIPYEREPFARVYVCGLEIEAADGEALVSYLAAHPEREKWFAPGPRLLEIPPKRLRRLLDLKPVVHLSEQEARTLSGLLTAQGQKTADMAVAAAQIQAVTKNTVIVTLGERGAYCLERDNAGWYVPGQAIQAVDTIGAGDAHIGAILAGLGLGLPLRTAVAAAGQIAAAVVAQKGASLPDDYFLRHPLQ